MSKKSIFLTLMSLLGVMMLSCTTKPFSQRITQSPQFHEGQFQNTKPLESMGLSKLPGYIKRLLTEKRVDSQPTQTIPVQTLTRKILYQLPDQRTVLFRLGHSSYLLKISGKFWLIDPVFSEYASPVQFMGPKRFHPTPISIEELPEIEGVLISHNHYDHLDKGAIAVLKAKTKHFYVPLGIGETLVEWGVAVEQIVEMDWWQTHQAGSLELVSTPAQHFSGRSLTDSNATLWCSWVMIHGEEKIFYSGDSGYFDGFRKIGEKFGPFDMSIIETGAYDKDWAEVHMAPEESLQAHIDVKGKRMLPAHNGTFDLAFHAWYEPLDRIEALANEAGETLITPMVGEAIY